MFRSTLVAQLLTLALDSQGVDVTSVMESFPEEFGRRVHGTENAARSVGPLPNASADLNDSLGYLLSRGLLRFSADGHALVPTLALERAPREDRFSLSGQEEAFGFVPLLDWAPRGTGPGEHEGTCAFEAPRLWS